MSLIAFSIVFLVCVGLMLLMVGLKHAAAAINKANDEKAAKAAAASQPSPAASGAPVVSAAVAASAEDEEEIVAVITAAIMAACGTGAKIMSITPAPPKTHASAWRMTGILQNGEGL